MAYLKPKVQDLFDQDSGDGVDRPGPQHSTREGTDKSRAISQMTASLLSSRNEIIMLQKQLAKWKANSLSQAGRCTLIHSNLQSKANYIMQSFLLLKGICDQIDTINKNFFLEQNGWYVSSTPQLGYGLGLNKAEHINIALQMKLLWKLMTDKDNFWFRIVTEKYLRNNNLLTYKSKPNQS